MNTAREKAIKAALMIDGGHELSELIKGGKAFGCDIDMQDGETLHLGNEAMINYVFSLAATAAIVNIDMNRIIVKAFDSAAERVAIEWAQAELENEEAS